MLSGLRPRVSGDTWRWVIAVPASFAALLSIYGGSRPGPLPATFQGNSLSAVFVFIALVASARWVLRTTASSVWPWAVGGGVVLATAELAGLSLLVEDDLKLFTPPFEQVAWVIVHWLGTSVLLVGGMAALLHATDRLVERPSSPHPTEGRGRTARFLDSLRSGDPSRRRRSVMVTFGLVALSRVPYLILWWPGILSADTFRAYSYARGTRPWDTYDPVGHSMLVGAQDWLGTTLGLGDAGGLAIASITQVLTSTAAFTFMLVRLAAWGLDRRIWLGALLWTMLLPVFGIFSVSIVKDVPFASAFVVFLVCVGEVVFGRPEDSRRWWPWITLVLSGVIAIGMRNNGVHMVLLSLVLLLIPLWNRWRRVLLALVATVVGYALYVGPVYAALDVQPGPAVEVYSVPIQQIVRIAREHRTELSRDERREITHIFSGMRPLDLVKHYHPQLSDPMKLQARADWRPDSADRILRLWVRLASRYPGTAAEATLANTVGYWDPEAPSYDGLYLYSYNDVRDIHLDIPSGEPTTGFRGWLQRSGIVPTRLYSRGQLDDGYRAIPILGLVMSPGLVCWAWVVAAVVVVRRRAWRALALFVPPAVMLLTFVAGPLSGGERYSLGLFAALPLAVGAALLATRRDRPASPGAASDNDEESEEARA